MPDSDISVVIPAYNRPEMVRRAVLSARLQSRPPREIIVVDDGSSDDTGSAAAAAGARVITQSNAGQPAARNAGLAAAESEWVAFLDSDDEWLPHHLATLEGAFTPALGMVASNARAVPSGRLVGHPGRGVLHLTLDRLIWPENPLSPSATVVRRTTALDVGGFPNAKLGEDRLFWIEMIKHSPGVVLPDVTCLYHEHHSQVSGDAEKMRRAREQILVDLVDDGVIDPALPERVRVVSTWDRAQQSSDAKARALELVELVRRPASARALATTLAYRFRLRRRGGL